MNGIEIEEMGNKSHFIHVFFFPHEKDKNSKNWDNFVQTTV